MSQSHEFIYLSSADLEALSLTITESIESIEHLLREQDASRAWAPPKAAIMIPDGRYMMATLAAANDPPLQAVKSVVLNPRNAEKGLPQINAMVTLLDGETGVPVAIVDGNWVTAIRTASLSAVAAKHLARPDSAVAAFIGCGVQAHSHLHAFSEMFPLKQVRVFGHRAANRDALCDAAHAKGYGAIASATGQEAIEGADIVVTTVTLSADLEPFLDTRAPTAILLGETGAKGKGLDVWLRGYFFLQHCNKHCSEPRGCAALLASL